MSRGVRPLVFLVGLLLLAEALTAQDIDFKELTELAQRYGLPMPSTKARPVLAHKGCMAMVDSPGGDHPGIYHPAFLLEEHSAGRASVMVGWRTFDVQPTADHRPAIRKLATLRSDPRPGGHVVLCNDLPAVATAIQFAMRGNISQARAIWEQLNNEDHFLGVGRLRDQPRILVAYVLFDYLYEAPLKEGSNLSLIHERLLRLQTEFPQLFSAGDGDFHRDRRTKFVHDLGLTVNAPLPKSDSVEAWLIRLGNNIDERDELPPSERAIYRRGLTGIAALKKLKSDMRLTRRQRHLGKGTFARVRLGELAMEVRREMTGTREPGEEDSESNFFRRVAIVKEGGVITGFNRAPMWILGQNHPEQISQICRQVPELELTDSSLRELGEALVSSRLPQRDKKTLLIALIDQAANPRQLSSMLEYLAGVDHSSCLEQVKTLLALTLKHVNETAWDDDAVSLAHVIKILDDDSVWKDLLKLTKRTHVELRSRITGTVADWSDLNTNRKRRLAFLAEFLDDEEFHFSIEFGRTQLRDYATGYIANMLKFSDRPSELWTPKRWERLREKVQTALTQETLPDLRE